MKNILLKYRNYLLVIAIALSAVAISIRSGEGKVQLVLKNYPILVFSMIGFSSLLILLYFLINDNRMKNLKNQIKEQSDEKGRNFKKKVDKLTVRQREVYDLIVSGKTNKEIMSKLFIEQSTLKTHINQIYKKLNIKNRNELKSF